MVVIVRAGGAHRMHVAIDTHQQTVSSDEQNGARRPADLPYQLGKQSEHGDPHQQSAAEAHG
jgi:hypothetical protein